MNEPDEALTEVVAFETGLVSADVLSIPGVSETRIGMTHNFLCENNGEREIELKTRTAGA
jgi:hypothetical protein